MRARTALWEPWGGNAPGPPGPVQVNAGCQLHSECWIEAHKLPEFRNPDTGGSGNDGLGSLDGQSEAQVCAGKQDAQSVELLA